MTEIFAGFSKNPNERASQPVFYIDRTDAEVMGKALAGFTLLSMKAAVMRMYPQELQVPESLRPERKIAEKRVRDSMFFK